METNKDVTLELKYKYVDVEELVRAKDHEEAFPYTDTSEYEGTIKSYEKHGRIFPVVYVSRYFTNHLQKHVIEGWKHILHARELGIKEVLCYEVSADTDEELIEIMVQLHKSNHESYAVLFWMIMKLWDKHHKGQGYRSDIKEEELDTPVAGKDGRRLNIYERIGLELNISGTKVKQIRKIGTVNPLHFERIEMGRFSLFQGYVECVRQEKGELVAVPKVKAPVYYTTTTQTPVFSEPSVTATPVFSSPVTTGAKVLEKSTTDTSLINESPTKQNAVSTTSSISSIISDDVFVTLTSTCPHCGEEVTFKINTNQIK